MGQNELLINVTRPRFTWAEMSWAGMGYKPFPLTRTKVTWAE